MEDPATASTPAVTPHPTPPAAAGLPPGAIVAVPPRSDARLHLEWRATALIQVAVDDLLRARPAPHVTPYKLSGVAMIQFQRYHFHVASEGEAVFHIAAACVTLAAKVCDFPHASLGHVVQSYLHRVRGLADVPRASKEYVEAEEAIMQAERRVLDATGYDFDFDLPWPHLDAMLPVIDPPAGVAETDLALRIVGDCLRSPVCLAYPMGAIVQMALVLAAERKVSHARAEYVASLFHTPRATLDAIKAAWMDTMIRAQNAAAAATAPATGGGAGT